MGVARKVKHCGIVWLQLRVSKAECRMWYRDLVSCVRVLKQLDCFNRFLIIHHRLPAFGKGHHLQKPAGSSMETSLSTSVPQVIEMVKYTENLNSFHIWVIICHIAVRRHSWINQVYPLSLVERNLSQFVTFENWGLICCKWIVIAILSIKIKKVECTKNSILTKIKNICYSISIISRLNSPLPPFWIVWRHFVER